jgi:hypothetical protein
MTLRDNFGDATRGVSALPTDIRQFSTRPPRNLWVNPVDFGADPTGKLDSTAAFQAAINLSSLGDGTAHLLIPSGWYLILGQLTQPTVPAGTNQTRTTAVRMVGVPAQENVDWLAGGTILDMRWDGGLQFQGAYSGTQNYHPGDVVAHVENSVTYYYYFVGQDNTNGGAPAQSNGQSSNANWILETAYGNTVTGDYAVVSGLFLQYTLGTSSLSLTSGIQTNNIAFINNATPVPAT